jgi:ribose/xylose/arabinose/galactoside ABC-type transport system permease subunit
VIQLAWIYRLIYIGTLALCSANVVMRTSWGLGAESVVAGLCVLASLLLIGTILTSGMTRRRLPAVLWSLAVAWCLLFGLFSWSSPTSPFVQHEAHTLDAVSADAEATRYKIYSAAIFTAMSLWFLSLPLVQGRTQRT